MAGFLNALVGRLRESLRPGEAGMLTDVELLGRWTGEGDQAAFELLVWRHGRLVLSVCQRLLSGPEDVEDAFQATFLVLARKAGGIAHRQALASWLHTVAHRVALRARERSGRRGQVSCDLDLVPDRRVHSEGGELRKVIDEEVGLLPEKYRLPFVLCCLEGRTNEEAARELGRPVGTILSQLSRARQRLRDRLARRGLAPSALAGPALAEAAVPAGLIAHTVEAALVVTGKNLAAGAVRASVAVLMEGALRGMFIAKLKFVAAVLLSVAVLGAGGGVGYRALSAGEPGTTEDTPRPGSSNKEVDALRAQLKQAQDQIAQLRDALKKAEVGRATPLPRPNLTVEVPAGDSATTRPASAVDREDVEILRARLEAKRAELTAAKAMAEEAARRLMAVEKSRAAVRGSVTEDDYSAVKVTALRYEAETKLREAELQEAQLLLKRAERQLGQSQPKKASTLEERVKALEDQLAEVKKELARERAGRKAGTPGGR